MVILKSLKENMKQEKKFIDMMDTAFCDLRSDYDVSTIYTSNNKLEELKKLNVDILGSVSSLAVKAPKTNGLVAGSRGTGKSHLLLLARHKINSDGKNFCVYINLKSHLKIDGKYFVDERFYSWVILNHFIEQLENSIKSTTNEGDIIEKIFNQFNKKEKKKQKQFYDLYNQIKNIIKAGEVSFHSFNTKEAVNQNSELVSNTTLNTNLSINDVSIKSGINETKKDNIQQLKNFESSFFIDLNTLKKYIIQIKELLNLGSIIFFYDEWSVLQKENQEKLSELIRGLSTSPIFHWIAYIPYMTSLGVLEKAADFTSNFGLDRKYIYEENKDICLKYFKEFANNRLNFVFNSDVFYIDSLLSNTNFDILVKACMGNTRDFGIILNYSWENYKRDYLSGKIYQKISLKKHIYPAIKQLGGEKESNLDKSKSNYSKKLWIEIKKFVDQRKYTHFCIEDNTDNINYVNDIEFQELMFYRLLHLRAKDLSGKDAGDYKLDLYACDVSSIFPKIFEVKSQDMKINIVSDSNLIHDKIRRYIFNLSEIMNKYRIEEGKQIQCSCGRMITSDMKLAFEIGKCPYCGTPFKQNIK